MEKPDFSGHELDFSQFHPLDHWPGTSRCRSLYGGTRNHLQMTWEFRRRPAIAYHLCCRFGRHRWCDGWTRKLGDCWMCANCPESREK